MSISISELFMELNEAGLTLRREGDGIAIAGDTSRITGSMRVAVQANLPALLACLPDPQAEAAKAANSIRELLDAWADEFAGNPRTSWLTRAAVESMDSRLARAVDTQQPKLVADTINVFREELDTYAWAAEVFPWAMEAEAKHAVEAGATGIGESGPDDEIPF